MRRIDVLSVVIPCHNEAEVIRKTHKRLAGIMQDLILRKRISGYEFVFVDNGSTDQTLNELKAIFTHDPHLRIISLRRNFGFQGSLSAGLHHAGGDAVVTIDADLQDPPEKIEEMISHFEQGYDLVLGVRTSRNTDSFFKRFFAENYYRLLKILGVNIVYNHADFRLMSKSLLAEFNALPERNRLIRAMILQLESRYAVVSYERQKRTEGTSKFTVSSLFSLSLDGLVSFTYVPLRFASLAGIISAFIAIAGSFWVLYIKLFTDKFIPGWASILLPVLAVGGLQLFALGIIGEYIGRLYVEVKQRPLFVVREEYTHTPQECDRTQSRGEKA